MDHMSNAEAASKKPQTLGELCTAPNLSPEEEIALFKRWRDHDDADARDKIINAHMKFARKEANTYTWAAPFDELLAAGYEGLTKAALKFDPDRGHRFITYARLCVKGALIGCIKAERNQDDEKEPILSLNRAVDIDGEHDGDTWLDQLPHDGHHETDILPIRNFLVEMANTLEDRERRILQARYLTHDPVLHEDLAHEFGVSRERVVQIEGALLRKVRNRCPWPLNFRAFSDEQPRPLERVVEPPLLPYEKPPCNGKPRSDKPTSEECKNRSDYLLDYKTAENRQSWSWQIWNRPKHKSIEELFDDPGQEAEKSQKKEKPPLTDRRNKALPASLRDASPRDCGAPRNEKGWIKLSKGHYVRRGRPGLKDIRRPTREKLHREGDTLLIRRNGPYGGLVALTMPKEQKVKCPPNVVQLRPRQKPSCQPLDNCAEAA
jgi:RNA polymerase sigma-32 factor